MNPLDRARAYLAKLPPAVSGAGGHNSTFRAACHLVRFGLADGDAMTLLREWNGTHCSPPWTERELAHKLADAHRVARGRARAFIQPKPAVRFIWKLTPRKLPKTPTMETVSPAAQEAEPGERATVQESATELHVLPPDQAAWLHTARQVLAGEWEGADDSTCESLTIGLRSIPHPDCREALARLRRGEA